MWDLAVFGHAGRLTFTAITQPWLRRGRQAVGGRGTAAPPRRRRRHVFAACSPAWRGCRESLRGADPTTATTPPLLGRGDIESSCTGWPTWSRPARSAAIAATRSAGTSRGPGRDPRAGADPPRRARRRAGRRLRPRPAATSPPSPNAANPAGTCPPEIMAVLCASLRRTLRPAEVRVATQIAIDTGRRPEDILGLPLDCLARDTDGAAVLVYDNHKARPAGPPAADQPGHRRSDHRPAAPGPGTVPRHPARRAEAAARPAAQPRRRAGRISIAMLDQRHRDWVDQLPALRTRDGTEFDKARIVPYAYRHTYAQRHADAGVADRRAGRAPRSPQPRTSPAATTGSGKTAAAPPSTR